MNAWPRFSLHTLLGMVTASYIVGGLPKYWADLTASLHGMLYQTLKDLMASIPPVRETWHVLLYSAVDLRRLLVWRWFWLSGGGLKQQTGWKSGLQKWAARETEFAAGLSDLAESITERQEWRDPSSSEPVVMPRVGWPQGLYFSRERRAISRLPRQICFSIHLLRWRTPTDISPSSV